MGLLADIYSGGDSLKRKVKGLLADPMGTIEQKINQFGEDQQAAINNAQDATGFGGNRSVLMSPQQKQQASKALGDYAGSMGLAGMFVGQGSSTWNKAEADKALKMAQSGADPRKIWSETGNWKGPDGAWRQEIDDSGAVFKKDFVSQLNAYGARKEGSVFKHKPLYDAYPETSDIVMMRNGVDDANSYGTYDGKNITLEVPRRSANLNQVKSTNIHELQHAIQNKEGFAKGGSPEALARDLPDAQAINDAMVMQALMRKGSSAEDAPSAFLNMLKRDSHPQARTLLDRTDLATLDPHSQYLRLAGEAEARATQARIPLDASHRRALFPEDSYDVPMNQLIIRGLLAK